MPARRIILSLAIVAALGLAVFFLRSGRHPGPAQTSNSPPAAKPVAAALAGSTGGIASRTAVSAAGDAPSPIADALNQPGGTVVRDLQIVHELLEAWQSNFPREGNPVGENAEITAALAGNNRLGFPFIRRGHPAINAQGELCDRWGTPLRFHQVSGTQMEIRSAGPDRRFATPDDAMWPPQVAEAP